MARIKYSDIIIDRMTKVLVETLTSVGWRVALDAYRSKTFTNRTYNLHDSYGSAVFVKGVLVKDSIKYVGRELSKKKDSHDRATTKTGREALHRFFKQPWVVRKKDDVTVVIAAAMWYGSIVESKGYTVLDSDFIKRDISMRLESELPKVVAKYPELKDFAPMIRRYLGIDEVYWYDE